MAIYHCSVKIVSRSKGRSATGAAAYRAGERINDERTGITHDYTRKSGVDYCEIMAPDDAPDWAHDREQLWNHAEAAERRKDAQVAREVEVALPRELDDEQQRELATGYAREQFVERGMIADVCLHHQDGDNPHAHILLTMRELDGDNFDSRKNREWNDTELLEEWRAEWERHANDALEKADEAERIDHRSYEDQGIERIPTIKLGAAAALEARGTLTERGDINREITAANDEYEAVLVELDHFRTEQREQAQEAQEAADLDAYRYELEQKDSDELLQLMNGAQSKRNQDIERRTDEMPAVREPNERAEDAIEQRWEAVEEQQKARQQFDELAEETREFENRHPIRASLHERGWRTDKEQAERDRATEGASQRLQDALEREESARRDNNAALQERNDARPAAKQQAIDDYQQDPARDYEKAVREVYMDKQREQREHAEERRAEAERLREQVEQRHRERMADESRQRRTEDDEWQRQRDRARVDQDAQQQERERQEQGERDSDKDKGREEQDAPNPERLAEHVRKYGHPSYNEHAQKTSMDDESRKHYDDMREAWKEGPKAAREQKHELKSQFERDPKEAERFTPDARNVQASGNKEREQQSEKNQQREKQAEQQQSQQAEQQAEGPAPQAGRMR